MKKTIIKVLCAVFVTAMIIGGASTVALAAYERPDTVTTAPVSNPEFFNNNPYDLPRYITPVKDQGQMGLCWAFAAAACAETEAIRNGGDKVPKNLDLSEWHLAYFAYNSERIGTGDTVYVEGNVPYYNLGGYAGVIPMILSNKIGFVTEDKAPMSYLKKYPNSTLLDSAIYMCDYQLENAYFYDPQTQIDEIKTAITQYGAAMINYHSEGQNSPYYNSDTAAYYCGDETLLGDHTVTIVGFDDNYSKINFLSTSRPSSDGAWLVKNSWGTSFGQNGYFWLSYEDATVSDCVVLDVEPVNERETLYSHDGGSGPMYMGLGISNVDEVTGETTTLDAMANIFTIDTDTDEKITAVGVYAMECDSTVSNSYKIDIYVNPNINELGEKVYRIKSSPTVTLEGDFFDGYNKIELEKAIEVENGDLVVVSVTTTMALFFDMDWTDVMVNDGTDYATVISDVNVSPMQTIMHYLEKEAWVDTYELKSDGEDVSFNARIKLYTEDATKKIPFYTVDPFIRINYGETLSKEQAQGNVVGTMYDPDDPEARVHGTWQTRKGFVENKKYSSGDVIYMDFVPNDSEIFATVTVPVTVYTNPVDFEVYFNISNKNSDKGGYYVGETVSVQLVLPDGMTIRDLGSKYEIYYKINGNKYYKSSLEYGIDIKEKMAGQILTIGFYFPGDNERYNRIEYTEKIMIENGERYMKEEETEAETVTPIPPKDDPEKYPEYNYDKDKNEYETTYPVYPNNGGSGNGGGNSGVASDSGSSSVSWLTIGGLIAAVVAVVTVGGGGLVVVVGGAAVLGGGGVGIFFLVRHIIRSKKYW